MTINPEIIIFNRENIVEESLRRLFNTGLEYKSLDLDNLINNNLARYKIVNERNVNRYKVDIFNDKSIILTKERLQDKYFEIDIFRTIDIVPCLKEIDDIFKKYLYEWELEYLYEYYINEIKELKFSTMTTIFDHNIRYIDESLKTIENFYNFYEKFIYPNMLNRVLIGVCLLGLNFLNNDLKNNIILPTKFTGRWINLFHSFNTFNYIDIEMKNGLNADVNFVEVKSANKYSTTKDISIFDMILFSTLRSSIHHPTIKSLSLFKFFNAIHSYNLG